MPSEPIEIYLEIVIDDSLVRKETENFQSGTTSTVRCGVHIVDCLLLAVPHGPNKAQKGFYRDSLRGTNHFLAELKKILGHFEVRIAYKGVHKIVH